MQAYQEPGCPPIQLEKSLQQRYFTGCTPQMELSGANAGWVGLVNPASSHTDMFIDVASVSVYSGPPLTAYFYLNALVPLSAQAAHFIGPANTVHRPLSHPSVWLRYADGINPPSGGSLALVRVVPTGNTTVLEPKGLFILPPGGNFAVYLKSLATVSQHCTVCFAWWEEPVFRGEEEPPC